MNVYKGVAAGAAGGLVAAFVMNQFQSALGKLMENEERPHGAQSLQHGLPDHGIGRCVRDEPVPVGFGQADGERRATARCAVVATGFTRSRYWARTGGTRSRRSERQI